MVRVGSQYVYHWHQRSIMNIGALLEFNSCITSPASISIHPIRLFKNLTSGIDFWVVKNTFYCDAHDIYTASVILWTSFNRLLYTKSVLATIHSQILYNGSNSHPIPLLSVRIPFSFLFHIRFLITRRFQIKHRQAVHVHETLSTVLKDPLLPLMIAFCKMEQTRSVFSHQRQCYQ